MMSDYSFLDNFPAGGPPAGEVSNLINPPTQIVPVVVICSVFWTLMITMVSIRFFVRLHLTRSFGPEDYEYINDCVGLRLI